MDLTSGSCLLDKHRNTVDHDHDSSNEHLLLLLTLCHRQINGDEVQPLAPPTA